MCLETRSIYVRLKGELRNAYRMFLGKPKGRPKRRWKNAIETGLKGVGYEDED
jgi:hypothetical protein